MHADKLVAADAEGGVAKSAIGRLSYVGVKGTREVADMGIARGVPLLVIDEFQVIQVPGHQQERPSCRPGEVLQALKLHRESMAVEQTRQTVMAGQGFQLFIGLIEPAESHPDNSARDSHED